MTWATQILQPLDAIRSIGGILGLRVFTVVVNRRVWSGGVPGAPGSTFIDNKVTLVNLGADGNKYPVRVRQLSRAEIVSSGGQYTDRDLRVGPMTPTFAKTAFGAAGGFDDTSMDPVPTATAVQMIWTMSSPNGTFGIPPGGVVCEKRGEDATALHYYAILRSTGRTPR